MHPYSFLRAEDFLTQDKNIELFKITNIPVQTQVLGV